MVKRSYECEVSLTAKQAKPLQCGDRTDTSSSYCSQDQITMDLTGWLIRKGQGLLEDKHILIMGSISQEALPHHFFIAVCIGGNQPQTSPCSSLSMGILPYLNSNFCLISALKMVFPRSRVKWCIQRLRVLAGLCLPKTNSFLMKNESDSVEILAQHQIQHSNFCGGTRQSLYPVKNGSYQSVDKL